MSALSIPCPTCNGTGENAKEHNGCSTCDGRGRVISDHIIEAAARKMYAEVGTRNSANLLTYDIAYPEEQADFLRVAEKMLWAGIEAAALEPAR